MCIYGTLPFPFSDCSKQTEVAVFRIYMLPLHYTVYTVHKGKRLLKENGNYRLFAANINGNRKFIFLGQQTINGNVRLLFQQTCPSMPGSNQRTVPRI